jgi:nucleotidyltransferase/DNA polymerase involved in DNA repair
LKFEICNPQFATPSLPLVIIRTVADRQVIVSLCDDAFQRGIRRGMTLTQARALCADVEHAEHDPARDRRALEALGRWLMRFTPTVALDSSQSADGIFLDITGCERLFGSVENIVRQVIDALASLRISAHVAVAPTPGAAWALAAHGQSRAAHAGDDHNIASPDTLLQMLAPLPPAALQISDDLAGVLHHLGLVRIGQVIDLPRGLLPARFGPELLLRIDQALGRIPEPLVPLEHLTPIAARMNFDGGVSSLEAIWAAFQQLIGEVIAQLTHRGCGARRLDVELLHFHEPPVRKSILLSRPSRDAVNLFNLFRCGMEEGEGTEARRQSPRRLNCGTKGKDKKGELGIANWGLQIANLGEGNSSNLKFEICNPQFATSLHDTGYSGMILRVPVFEPLTDHQIGLLGQQEYDGQMELDRLIERLRIRLGEQSVASVQLAESHIPEKSWQCDGTGKGKIEGTTCPERSRREVRRQSQRRLNCGTKDKDKKGELGIVFDPEASDRRANWGLQIANLGEDNSSTLKFAICNPQFATPPSLPPIRPLHLFPHPMEIRVMVSPSDDAEGQPAAFTHNGEVRTIVHSVGPERITGRWWDGHDKTRDYFDVEDTTARRHWLFRVRETSKWYLHGGFE